MAKYLFNSIGMKGRIHLQNTLEFEPETPKYTFTLYDTLDSSSGNFGYSMSIDGNILAISNPDEETVYIYEYDGSDFILKFNINSLFYGIPNSGFGYSLKVKSTRIIIGCPQYDNGRGCVKIFEINSDTLRDITGSAFTPFDSENDGNYGFIVDMTESIISIGSPNTFNGATERYGSVYLFQYNNKRRSWVNPSKITNPGTQTNSGFGETISLESDNLCFISAHKQNINYSTEFISNGCIYVYSRNGSTWSYETRIIPQFGQDYLFFGKNIKAESGIMISGMPGKDNIGGSLLYNGFGDSWNLIDDLSVRNTSEIISDTTVNINDDQGFSNDISLDVIVVGSIKNLSKGCVYVFEKSKYGNIIESNIHKLEEIDTVNYGHMILVYRNILIISDPLFGGSGKVFIYKSS